MSIFLVFLVTVCVAVTYGNPPGNPGEINSNLPAIQNSANERFRFIPSHEILQGNQPNRIEYRRIGKDVFSHADNLPIDINANERETILNINSDNQYTLQNKNQLPAVSSSAQNERPHQVQKSSNSQLNQRQDSVYNNRPTSEFHQAFSNQDLNRSGRKALENQIPIAAQMSQEHIQKGNPLVEDSQSGQYQNNFDGRFSRVNDHRQSERTVLETQKNVRSKDGDKSVPSHLDFYQTNARKDGEINQGNQYLPQIPTFNDPGQIPSTPITQGQLNRYQNTPEENQRSFTPLFTKDNMFTEGQTPFDSKRFSSTAIGQTNQLPSADQRSSTAQYLNSSPEEKLLNRRLSGIDDVQTSNGFGVMEDSNERYSTESLVQDDRSNPQVDYQQLFQSIRNSQPILITSQLKQNLANPVVIPAAKTASILPMMVYKTGSIASPHAVVLGKDSRILNKASITQHLQTPYAQYSYTHSL